MRAVASIFIVLVGLGLLGCPSTPDGASLDFPTPPTLTDVPMEWRPRLLVEQEYPPIPPMTLDERKAAGRALILHDLRIDGSNILALSENTFLQIDGRGRFAAQRFELTRKDETHYDLSYALVRPDLHQHLVMTLNTRMQLIHYVMQRDLLGADDRGETIRRTSYTRATWKSDQLAYLITDSDGSEIKVLADEPLLPVEALPLLALIAPSARSQALFPTVAIMLRGIYDASLETRPALRDQAKHLSFIRSLSPLGESYQFFVKQKDSNVITSGRVGERMRIYPVTAKTYQQVETLGSLVRRERDRLYFNRIEIFSRLDEKGRAVKPQEDGKPRLSAWLIVPTDPLDLVIGNAVPASPGQIVGLSDRQSLENFKPQPFNPRSPEDEGAAPSIALESDQNQIQMRVALDVMPFGYDLDSYVRMFQASLLQDLDVVGLKRTRLQTHTSSGIRIDSKVRVKGANPDSSSRLYLSSFIIERAGTIIRIEFAGSGDDVSSWWGSLDTIYSGVRVLNPPLKVS